MHYYKLSVKLKSGLLSELQSDTIFGHFCWRMIERLGEEKLKKFLDHYHNNSPVFTVSNSMLEDDKNIFFPKPILQIKNQDGEHKENKTRKISRFLKYKDDKKIKLVTLKTLNNILAGNSEPESIVDQPKFEENLRVSVEIDRNTFSSKKGQLFSYSPKYLDKKYNLAIFIKSLNDDLFKEFKCPDLFVDTFTLGFGKKKSSGYGQFEIIENKFPEKEFTDFKEPENPDGFITLSNYLPSQSDGIGDANYDFHVKYGKLGEQFALSPNPFKKPIIFFKPGSTFKTSVKKDFYGRCTKEGEISTISKVIQNGIAYTLGMKT